MPDFKTLEEAKAEIIRLQGINTEVTNERDTLSQNNKTLTEELESVRTLNQQYFNKLCAQFSQQEDETNDEDEVQSCEEFAKTLNII